MTLVFRRWRRPSVKPGGTLKTEVGVLAIDRVAEVDRSDIGPSDARRAGYPSPEVLLAELDTREGDLYRVEVRYAGEDPRLALRNDDEVDPAELDVIRRKLDRYDAASRVGPWTCRVLLTIRDHPHVAAASLAESTGFDKEWLKTNVRKLKNLGLTISHQPGYELSPRGTAVLRHLRKSG
ncbi:MAG: hypothetical protein AAF800_06660 [Planctomycetota bacterium]